MYGNWKGDELVAFDTPSAAKNTHQKYLHAGGRYIAQQKRYYTGKIRNFRVFNYTKTDRTIPAVNVTAKNLPFGNEPFRLSMDVKTKNSDAPGLNTLLGFGDFEFHLNSQVMEYTIEGDFSMMGIIGEKDFDDMSMLEANWYPQMDMNVSFELDLSLIHI